MKSLDAGQTVLLRLERATALAARVDAVEPDAAALILLTPPLRPPHTGQTGVVEATTERGIVTLDVRVVAHDRRGTVRVALRGAATERRAVQRRDFVRVDASVPVVVRDGGPDGPAHEAYTVNVSGGGLLLSGLSHLGAGDFAWVAIDLEDGGAPVEALVTVVRQLDGGARAVRLASVSARDEQRLVRFSFTREQRARIARDA